jgi:hypothetical protein
MSSSSGDTIPLSAPARRSGTILLGNMKKEVYATLGINDFDPYHRVVNFPIGRYQGRVAANFGGAWMDGDDLTCIVDGGFTFEFSCDPMHCLGTLLHEFGHVLGLEHTGPEEDCMFVGFSQTTWTTCARSRAPTWRRFGQIARTRGGLGRGWATYATAPPERWRPRALRRRRRSARGERVSGERKVLL